MKIHRISDSINTKFDSLPKLVQFVISWMVIIPLLIAFFWFNSNYLHLGEGGGSNECTGTFEYNCGDIEDTRINEDYEPPQDDF